jgi:hypothetical protein
VVLLAQLDQLVQLVLTEQPVHLARAEQQEQQV